MKHIFATVTLALAVLAALAAPRGTSAQARERCFSETGFCVRGEILDYWEQGGGLAVFGYPISSEVPNEIVEGSWVGRTQWFERDRLEVHAGGVLAGRMGARLLELQGRNWFDLPQFAGELPRGCIYFEETRHSLCEPFLSYWRGNGGLARFGYPLSEPMHEQVGDWSGTVQYFERRRMEHHLELSGTRYAVLLGLLGRDIYTANPPSLCVTPIAEQLHASLEAYPHLRENLGCPGFAHRDASAAVQPFERGSMIWADLERDGKKIYWIYRSPYAPGKPLFFQAHDDTWVEGVDPIDYALTPPPERYAPQRGFGKLWVSNKFAREDLGWGREPERAARAVVQRFSGGAVVLWLKGTNTVYVLGPNANQVALLDYRPD